MELGPKSPFVRCLSCSSWCCSIEVDWCHGRIDHAASPGTKEQADSELLHLPMPSPCRDCVTSSHANAWRACSGRQTALCPSIVGEVYCPECTVEHSGRRCVCGAVWLCDTCSTADSPDLVSCPRCGTTYCTREDGCRYCHFCQICRWTDVCFGCQAREEEDVVGRDTPDERPRPVKDFKRCIQCRAYMCGECCSTAKHGVAQCLGCNRWLCCMCGRRSSEGKWCRACH